MQMTSEEAKVKYNSIDFKSMDERIIVSMMEIIHLSHPEEAYTLFHKVIERFSKDELAFLACTHIAEKFKELLDSFNKQKENKPILGSSFDDFFNNLKK